MKHTWIPWTAMLSIATAALAAPPHEACEALTCKDKATTVNQGVRPPETLVNTDRHGVAMGGYDPVSYFVDGKPASGDPGITTRYAGALYRFVSREHREMFEKAPGNYAPAYGGFGGYAAAGKNLKPAKPKLWSIAEGRLVLQHSRRALERWNQDVQGNIEKADRNWPSLVQRDTDRRIAAARHPYTWPWFYETAGQTPNPQQKVTIRATVAPQTSKVEPRTPAAGDLDWPGF